MRHRRGQQPDSRPVVDAGAAFEKASKLPAGTDSRKLTIACDTRGTLTGPTGHGVNKTLLAFLIQAKLRGHDVRIYDPLGVTLNGAAMVSAMRELQVPSHIQDDLVKAGLFQAQDRARVIRDRVFDLIIDDDGHHYSGSQALLYANPAGEELRAFLAEFSRDPAQDLWALMQLHFPALEPVSELEAKPDEREQRRLAAAADLENDPGLQPDY